MSWYAIAVIAPVCGLCACGVAHIAYNWLTGGRKLLYGFLCGIISGWSVEAIVSAFAIWQSGIGSPDAVAFGAMNQVTYLALAYGYSNAINILITALRIRLFHEIATSDNGMTAEDMLQKYSARDLVDTRLRRLVASQRLRYEDGRYFTAPNSMLTLAKLCRFLKVLLLRRGK